MNPAGCKTALEAMIAKLGLTLRVAIVEGDDVMPRSKRCAPAGCGSAGRASRLPPRLLTANAYLGALPIKAALDGGADIVITGRCADSALALGMLMHEFGWAADDYDRLAAGSLVGHILECGPQATGGIFTDWDKVPDWVNIGYPIAECFGDGRFVISKPEGTGGLIIPGRHRRTDALRDRRSRGLYPARCRRGLFRSAPDPGRRGPGAWSRARAGARRPELQSLRDLSGRLSCGRQRLDRRAGRRGQGGEDREALIARARMNLPPARPSGLLGDARRGARGRSLLRRWIAHAGASREVLLRLVVEHASREALEIFARELGSVGLSCAPGTTGIYNGRPKPTPVVRLFTFFIDKRDLGDPVVTIGDGAAATVAVPAGEAFPPAVPVKAVDETSLPDEPTIDVPLSRLAYARSGDKGNSSNIAIIAREPRYLPLLRREVTPERVVGHLGALVQGPAATLRGAGTARAELLIDRTRWAAAAWRPYASIRRARPTGRWRWK